MKDFLNQVLAIIVYGGITPLSLTISTTALFIWIAIIGVGSYVATLYPARRASKLSTREALAYE